MSDPEQPDDPQILAGEYVLGLLDDRAAGAVDTAAAADPALAHAIARWRDRFDPLTDRLPPSPPSAALWHRIEASLDAAAPATVPLRRAPRRRSYWRELALSSLVIAATLAGLILSTPRPVPGPRAVALLTAPGSLKPAVRAQVWSQGTITLTPITGLPGSAGHHLGFWAWPSGQPAPVLLGTLPKTGGELRFPYPIEDGTPVMVTSEPDSGSEPNPGPTLLLGLLALT